MLLLIILPKGMKNFLSFIAIPAAAAKSLQSCLTVQPHRRQPTRLPCPWDSPGKNTGVGCHFLLQCMKVKNEREVAQSCPTPSDPMDCSLQGSSVHGIFQARVLEWVGTAFSIAIPTNRKSCLITKSIFCYLNLISSFDQGVKLPVTLLHCYTQLLQQ